ncbi:MAG: PilZ domain-containing protein [bacterium]|nr:PilZ domain-containing protein [bacterium]
MLPREKRKDYRIQDILAIEYQVLSPGEYEAEKARLENQPSGVRSLKDRYANFLPEGLEGEGWRAEDPDVVRGLLKLIISLNEKVDLILSHLEGKGEVSIYRRPPQEVSLSASGVGFCSSEYIPAETYVKVRMLLPQTPQILITTLGKVVRVTTKQIGEVKKFEVGILFLDIHEDDQEAIIKHIFTRQRDILRSRAKI